MKTVTLLEFRRNAEGILQRVGRGERFVITRRGHPAARLEPVVNHSEVGRCDDPFLTIARRATPSPKGKTRHTDIDRILYGRK